MEILLTKGADLNTRNAKKMSFLLDGPLFILPQLMDIWMLLSIWLIKDLIWILEALENFFLSQWDPSSFCLTKWTLQHCTLSCKRGSNYFWRKQWYQKYWNIWSPLYRACEFGHHNIVECLVNHGADINEKNNEYLY